MDGALLPGGLKVTPRRNQLADAAIRCFTRIGICETTYPQIVLEAGLPRSTAQREFRNKGQVLAYLHAVTVAAVNVSINRRIRQRSSGLYAVAVKAGSRGLLEGIALSPWTAVYLSDHPGEATAYLLTPERDGLIEHLARYTARCAERATGIDVTEQATRFVARILTHTCQHLSSNGRWPSDDPIWPGWIDQEADDFVVNAGLFGAQLSSPPPLISGAIDGVGNTAGVLMACATVGRPPSI